MKDTIDVHDLSEKEVQFLEELVGLLRLKKAVKANEKAEHKEAKVELEEGALGVKGTLSRREMYEF